MKYFKKLIGNRLYLSPMNITDAETYVKWLNDLKVTDGLGTSCKITSLESEKDWLAHNTGEYQFAIVTIEDNELIGNCGINAIDHIRQCGEIGLFIGEEENRNMGYGQEALHLLLEYSFDYLNLNNIMLRVFSFNERAISCYKKAGFKEIGHRRKSYYLKGKYYDEVYMDILKEEFQADRTF